MEDKEQKSNGGLSQDDESTLMWQFGRGPNAVTEYLFGEPSLDCSSDDKKVAALSDEEKRTISKMVHFFLQARYEKASAEAERCLNSPYPEIRIFALLAHAIANVAQNNIEIAQKDFQTLQREAQHPENERSAALNDVYRFILSVFFHLGDDIAPIPPNNLLYCSEGIRLYIMYARSYSLYLKQQYAQALGVAEAALIMATDRHPIISLYLYVTASMAAINLSQFEQADRFFLNALEIAKPEGYIQPFIGHHGPLQGLVEKHIREKEPELYKLIAENVVRFRHGWTEVHNPQSSNKVTNLLTPYEFALAMMAAKGKTNQEIADYFYISISTVKSYLSVVYQKLGITKRSELDKYLNK